MTAETRGRGRPPKYEPGQISDLVRKSREAGVLTAELLAAVGGKGRSEEALIVRALRIAIDAKTLAWVSDAGPGKGRRRRYYAAEFAPSVTGEASQRDTLKDRAARRCLPDVEPGRAMEGEAVIPPTAKITVAETPKPRFYVDPDTVIGGFRTMGPGRYLDGVA